MKLNKHIYPVTFFLFFTFMGCFGKSPVDQYYSFGKEGWHRFQKITFHIPVEQVSQQYDIIFYAYYNHQVQCKTLEINMVMSTPSGEERINTYQLNFETDHKSLSDQHKTDSNYTCIFLKKELDISEKGVLSIEIENLSSKLYTPGLLGVGVRMEKI